MSYDAYDVIYLLRLRVYRDGDRTEIRVNCPFCIGKRGQPDNHGHMDVNRHLLTYHCNRCGAGGSLVQLYAKLTGLPYLSREDKGKAKTSLQEKLGRGEQAEWKTQRKGGQCVSSPEESYPLDQIIDCYEALHRELSLCSAHREALLEKRGLNDWFIEQAGYRSAPLKGRKRLCETLLGAGHDLSCIPGFYVDHETGEWDIAISGSGILIPQRSFEGRITGFQNRLDHSKKLRYLTLSSPDLLYGTSAKCFAHFVGYQKGSQEIYVTEGALKADIAHFFTRKFFVAIPGVNHIQALSEALSLLVTSGIETVNMCFDMDKISNPNVLAALEKAADLFRRAGLQVNELSWDIGPKEELKGIDDYYKGMADGAVSKAPEIRPFLKQNEEKQL